MVYKGDLGSSPLDGVANFFAAVGDKKKAAKAKVEEIKGKPADLKAAAKAKVTAKKDKVVNCQKLGHKGKRGSNCARCGSKLL